MNKISELLQQFCEEIGSHRVAALGKPFDIKDYTYATNGLIIIRTKTIKAKANKLAPQNAPDLFIKWFKEDEPHELDISNLPEVVWATCDSCDGTGIIDDFDEEFICYDCKGKKREKLIPFKIGKKKLATKFLRLIAKLEDVRIYPNAHGEEDPMPFTFKQGEGLLMPMTKDSL